MLHTDIASAVGIMVKKTLCILALSNLFPLGNFSFYIVVTGKEAPSDSIALI